MPARSVFLSAATLFWIILTINSSDWIRIRRHSEIFRILFIWRLFNIEKSSISHFFGSKGAEWAVTRMMRWCSRSDHLAHVRRLEFCNFPFSYWVPSGEVLTQLRPARGPWPAWEIRRTLYLRFRIDQELESQTDQFFSFERQQIEPVGSSVLAITLPWCPPLWRLTPCTIVGPPAWSWSIHKRKFCSWYWIQYQH